MFETVNKSLIFVLLDQKFNLDKNTSYEMCQTRLLVDPSSSTSSPSLVCCKHTHTHAHMIDVYNINSIQYIPDNKCFPTLISICVYFIRARAWVCVCVYACGFVCADFENRPKVISLRSAIQNKANTPFVWVHTAAQSQSVATTSARLHHRRPFQTYYIVYCRRFYCRTRVTRLASHVYTREYVCVCVCVRVTDQWTWS